jgi:hypothetical protein
MMSSYYEVKSADGDNVEEEDDESADSDTDSTSRVLNIFESLPHILRETLFELNAIFADLKTTVAFDQNILVTKSSHHGQVHDEEEDSEEEATLGDHSVKLREMCHDSNNKFMAYMLVNSLILGISFTLFLNLDLFC